MRWFSTLCYSVSTHTAPPLPPYRPVPKRCASGAAVKKPAVPRELSLVCSTQTGLVLNGAAYDPASIIPPVPSLWGILGRPRSPSPVLTFAFRSFTTPLVVRMQYDTIVSTGFTSPVVAGFLLDRDTASAEHVAGNIRKRQDGTMAST